MILLDGKKLRDLTMDQLKSEVSDSLAGSAAPKPQLAIIQVGDLSESNSYISQKKLFAEKIGAIVLHKKFEAKVSEADLIQEINRLNLDNNIHGIIVQLPIPEGLSKHKIIDTIEPIKDVDGLTAINLKKLSANHASMILPATVLGVLSILKHYEIQIDGKKAVIVGRSMLVGKPLALALLNENATVTVCHRHTKNLKEETKLADILIVAAGSAHLITKDYVRKGQVVVDVGINFGQKTETDAKKTATIYKPENEITKKKMVGDVDFEAVKDIVSAISPVPGGIGPMTVASLFQNLVRVWKTQSEA
ncbi:TPA: bifunctional methylenetetrahydrofolate dehydrogenase/methenyltetrahydrofolate cyclohydrolase [Candidatus Taylorbacteria bacterium]|nr:bifunctional methylenetetrahydrofolate dehydrogenase/methenyltetrahydrofolate cyclohydrolase [Candidatus Taylorbacteria bacterium]